MLETIAYFCNLIAMESISRKLSLFLLVQFMFVVHVSEASDSNRMSAQGRGIATNVSGLVPVYKFTDSKGKVTYSTSSPTDFIQAEQVTIIAPPSPQQLDEAKRRVDEMKTAVDEFDVARAEKEAIREQNNIKRLQRLALINQAKPSVVTREFIYPAYPYRLRRKQGSHHGMTAHRPSRSSHGTSLSLPPSSFPVTYH